ncbi:DUF3828 domain-containing protein [Microvirga alba]|uniref:DUF3828 domain-containing protein n=1 Tax=Microvirga alba TaxID=2791025 RepID=A0A931FTT6_9HYPH|nr:DUF3828 domain-containing protein [Microvirga alba]MBF9234981.1 DUF3828 domain-containing protein [Microvirga alba]
MIRAVCKIVSRKNYHLLATAIVFLFGALWSPSYAADTGAKQFLESIYKAYVGTDADAIDWRGSKTQQYFDASLTKLILQDLRESGGEVGRIDFDPFVYAQDFDIKDLDITVVPKGAQRAAGIVSFTNVSSPTKVTYDLAKTSKGWRIANVSWEGAEAGAGNIRTLLSRPLTSSAQAD